MLQEEYVTHVGRFDAMVPLQWMTVSSVQNCGT